MKGIIMAGGTGSRLFPITMGVSKQLLPVYDKPMVYYPLSVLMLAKIKDVLIITTGCQQNAFINILGDGSKLGITISYCIQNEPKGLAEAFLLGKDFIANDPVALVLGDNFFFGQGFTSLLLSTKREIQKSGGGTLFSYPVQTPEQFGVIEVDESYNIVSIEEKPEHPKSNLAITGLYFYDNQVVDIAKTIGLSSRGEYEITDINRAYLSMKQLTFKYLGRGFAWLDTGTVDNLLEASHFVQTMEKRQGYKVACLEEIAYSNEWIDLDAVHNIGKALINSNYGKYLLSLS